MLLSETPKTGNDGFTVGSTTKSDLGIRMELEEIETAFGTIPGIRPAAAVHAERYSNSCLAAMVCAETQLNRPNKMCARSAGFFADGFNRLSPGLGIPFSCRPEKSVSPENCHHPDSKGAGPVGD